MQTLKKPIAFETAYDAYTATALIGQGGAGRVFAAEDSDGTRVAVKLLNASEATTDKRKRFKNEIGFLRRSSHKNLVPLLGDGMSRAAGAVGPFYVMPRYDGSLRDLFAMGIAPSEVIRIFGQLLDGVEAAHLLKAVHRDLKPENVLYKRKGIELTLAVADFGVASFHPDVQETLVETKVGSRLANFDYHAPEQRRSGGQTDQRTDVFALGLMLNEMFTREVPRGAGFKRVAAVAPEMAYVDALIEAMIQQAPSARPASVEDVKRRLRLDHELAMVKQRLGSVPDTVVADSEVDDPLVTDPVRLIDAKWNNGTLTLNLSRPVNDLWVQSLLRMGSYESVMGCGPETFTFRGDVATARTDGQDAQRVINYFKVWLPLARSVYEQAIIRSREELVRRENEQLRRERAELEHHRRVNESLKI